MPDALFICLIDARLEKRQRERSPLINVASERCAYERAGSHVGKAQI